MMKIHHYPLLATFLLPALLPAQWVHVGPGAISPSAGMQSVGDRLYYHATGNTGKQYVSEDLGASWDTVQFSTLGSADHYAEHNGVEYLSFYNGYSGGVRLWRKNQETGHYQQKHLSCERFRVLETGRVVLCTRNNVDQVVISDDQGDTWTTTFRGSGAFRSRLLGRDAEGRLLVQTYEWNGGAADSLGLWRSADQGQTWSKISDILWDLTDAHLGADGHIYCSNGRRILHSPDNGQTWDAPREVTFAHSGYDGSALFHAGEGRVYFIRHAETGQWNDPINLYVSNDHAHTWAPVQEAMAEYKLYGMVQHGGALFLGSTNGVYRLSAPLAVANYAPRAVMHLYPNPACDRVVVSAGVQRLKDVRIFDMAGHEVLAAQNMDMPAYLLDVSGLGSGMYVVRGITANGTVTNTLVVD